MLRNEERARGVGLPAGCGCCLLVLEAAVAGGIQGSPAAAVSSPGRQGVAASMQGVVCDLGKAESSSF